MTLSFYSVLVLRTRLNRRSLAINKIKLKMAICWTKWCVLQKNI